MGVSAGGCGSGSTDTRGAAPQDGEAVRSSSLSRKAYIEKASAVCARAGAKILDGLSSGNSWAGGRSKSFAVLTETLLVPTIEDELEDLTDLGAPTGDTSEVEAILDALQGGIAKAKGAEISSLEAFGSGFAKFDKLVRSYGMSGCAFGLV